MCCKLLLNLVECIVRKTEDQPLEGRAMIVRILETFILKVSYPTKYRRYGREGVGMLPTIVVCLDVVGTHSVVRIHY